MSTSTSQSAKTGQNGQASSLVKRIGRWGRAVCAVVAMAVGAQSGPVQAQTVYYHNDNAGSPIAATDESGTVLWRESFKPYGERLLQPTTGNSQWFHGKLADADTGLEDFGARNYDPVLGRFLSVDPVDVSGREINGFNRYAYGNNNPLKYKDPDGRFGSLVVPLLVTATVVVLAATTGTKEQQAARMASLRRFGNAILSMGSGGEKEAQTQISGEKPAADTAGTPPPDDGDGNKSRAQKRQEKIDATLSEKKLPTEGEVTFEPPKRWNPSEPLPRGNQNGFMDKYGREWVKGPSRTAGESFEWDVQLNDGTGRHINVSWTGKITH